jgi:hypothetical protein
LAKANKRKHHDWSSLDADVQGALDMGLDAIFFNTVQVEQEIKQVNHLLELKNIYNHEKANISSTIIHFKFWFSQYNKAVIVPIKYEFTSTDNQYRLATISKYNLNNAGFEAFMTMSR